MRKKAIELIASFVVGFALGLAIAIALELFEIGGFFHTIGLIFPRPCCSAAHPPFQNVFYLRAS